MLHLLPPDVLTKIILAEERRQSARVLRSGKPLRAAYILSQLCRYLRSFAYSFVGSLTDVDFRQVDSSAFLTAKTCNILCASSSLQSFCAVYTRLDNAGIMPLLYSPVKRLELRGLSGVTPTFLGSGTVPVLSCVEHLDLSYIEAVQGETLSALSGLTRLQTLVLEGCRNVGDSDVRALCRAPVARSVRHLNMKYCQIGDETVALLLKHFTLTTLILAGGGGNLWSIGGHTQAGVEALREQYPSVNISLEI